MLVRHRLMELEKIWRRASLTVASKVLTIAQITAALGSPTDSSMMGELMSPRNKRSARFKENIWSLDSQVDSTKDIEVHLAELLRFLEIHAEAIKQITPQVDMRILCSLSLRGDHDGFCFPPSLTQLLARYQVTLYVDLYKN